MFQGKHIDRQAEKLADVQDETHVNRLKDLEAETLVPMLFNTLAEVQENHLATLLTKWRSRQGSKRWLTREQRWTLNKLGNTLVNYKAVALIDVLDSTLANVETKRLGETLGDVREEALVNMIAYGLAEVQAKALGDTSDEVEGKRLVDMLPDTLVDIDGETFILTQSDLLAQILVDT